MSIPASAVHTLESTTATLAALRTAIGIQASTLRAQLLLDRTLPVAMSVDAAIAAEYIDSAVDELLDALETLEAHIPGHTPAPGEEPTLTENDLDLDPHPHEPATCAQCDHTLRMDNDGRCTSCGYEH
jgi:hypothetical protein